MSNAQLLATDRAGIVGVIDPDATSAGTVTTGWVAAKEFVTYMAVVLAGTLGASATIDAKLEQATDGSGTGAKDIDGKAITQLTKVGSDDDKQAVINLRQEELDVNNAFSHFRLSITVGTATSDVGAIVLGMNPAYGTAAANDVDTVTEIVA